MRNIPIIGLACSIEALEPILIANLGADDYQLMAESTVTARDGKGGEWRGDDPAAIGDVLTRLMDGRTIENAVIGPDGSLSLDLDSEAGISFLPDPDYESWWIVGKNGFRVVCMPGGGLAEWG
ncbi:DUF6188 family protein [Nocardia sp. NPDC058666]|uniref:DUF6188 family protein n=1 Tax=unclassified Nocardia TaxID=2637762 RepID=UPI00364E63A6